MARRRPAEIHVNHERWLVSYADFITLLFAFFVVMYSISQVNQSKYRVLSETFDHAFNAQHPTAVDTSADGQLSPVIDPIPIGEPSLNPADAVDHQGSDSSPVDPLQEMSNLFGEHFGDLIKDNLVTITNNELWLQIELKDNILFSSGGAEPSLQARAIFDEIAGIIKGYPNPVQVEGFTDNIPINSSRYPSNWELSSARASAIVKLLVDKGVAPQRLSAVGYAEFQPIASNDNAAGRAQNRRVALMISRARVDRPSAGVEQQIAHARPSSSADNQSSEPDSTSSSPAATSVPAGNADAVIEPGDGR